MTDGASAPQEDGRPGLGPGRRSSLLVVCVVVIALVVIATSVAVITVLSGSTSAPPGFPVVPEGNVLFSGQAQGVETLFAGQFTVPPPSNAGALVQVEVYALVNVSCGGSSLYTYGLHYNCSMSLVSGPTGGPTENQLWMETFTGYVASNISLLSPGAYTLFVHVVVGSPPLPVLSVPFSVAAEAAILR